jgi:hypothetical protein
MLSYMDPRLMLAVALLVAPAVCAAQIESVDTRVVTLVQLDGPSDRPAMVYRRVGGAGDRDVITLSPEATADDLSRALRVLDALHTRFGPSPERDMAAAIRSESAPAQPDDQATARRKVHGSFVSAVRRAERREVGGFGAVKAIQITVPARRAARTGE